MARRYVEAVQVEQGHGQERRVEPGLEGEAGGARPWQGEVCGAQAGKTGPWQGEACGGRPSGVGPWLGDARGARARDDGKSKVDGFQH